MASLTLRSIKGFDLTWSELDANFTAINAELVAKTGSFNPNFSGQMTYGGVTLNGAVTGTGNMVLSNAPTLYNPTLSGLTSLSLPLTGLLKGTGSGNNIAAAAPGTDYVTPTGSETLANKTLANPTIANYTEAVYAPAAGSTFTVDLANGTKQKFTTNANTTITLPASVAGKGFEVTIVYGGAHTITWTGGTSLRWAGGTAPTPTSVSGKIDRFLFSCDGVMTLGMSGGSNF